MSGICEGTKEVQAGHSCRRLWMAVLGASAAGVVKRAAPEHPVSMPFLGLAASVLLGFACASAALAATTASQAHGVLLATQLPPFLMTDKHPMALALLAVAIMLILGRGYYLYRVLSQRDRLRGIKA